MVAQITVERILRDDDDMSGQTIRQWKIEVHAGHVTIRSRDELSFLMIRAADIPIFRLDLNRAEHLAKSLGPPEADEAS